MPASAGAALDLQDVWTREGSRFDARAGSGQEVVRDPSGGVWAPSGMRDDDQLAMASRRIMSRLNSF